MRREARGGLLVLGGGFGGAYVARLAGKAGVTVVSPESAMLYTPLLPEVAAGTIEPRHAVVPLRQMCPHADIVRGRAVTLDEQARVVGVETEVGALEVEYERLVVALGAVSRSLPIPGLAEHTIPFKNLTDAMYLRNHVLREVDRAEADPARAERHLTFVFVGAGYAGVEALAELTELVADAVRHYPRLRNTRQRWLLVDAAPRILGEVPAKLAEYTTALLQNRGVDLRLSTTVDSVEPHAITLAGRRIETDTVVWTAGITPNPVLRELGLPLDDRGRVIVDEHLLVEGRADVWALGDCARVPNAATPGHPDPPTCQHALRQARRLAKSMRGRPKAYRYRSLGQGATLGRDQGIANLLGALNFRGFAGSVVTRLYHLHQVPLFSRRLRVLADGLLAAFFRRDIAELGAVDFARAPSRGA